MEKIEMLQKVNNKLSAKYGPFNYLDTYSTEILSTKRLLPKEVMYKLFTKFPWWIEWLMKLRTIIVKPLGLKGSDFEEHLDSMIQEQNDDEIIFGMNDKHLAFYVCIWSSELTINKQTITISPVVKYNNIVGKIYFFFIKPFHKLIVRKILQQI